MLPPYNEHLIRDIGDFYLAFAILFAWAAWRPSRELVVPLAAAWSIAALLHAVYHALNLDGFGAGDAIALTAVLVAVQALPVLAIVLTQREQVPIGG
jgi:predicted PurR-regulated permease PerM